MDIIVKHTWVDFFTELADKIRPYRGRGEELIDKIDAVYKYAQETNAKLKNNLSKSQLDKFEVDYNQVDPITIFGVINRGLTEPNRIALCKGFKTVFAMSAPIPTDFNGIPVMQNQQSWLLANDYDLWDIFEAAMDLSDHGTDRERFIQLFDAYHAKHTGIRYLTFGLFWSRPYFFAPLDSNSESFIKKTFPEVFSFDIHSMTGEQYLNICTELKKAYHQHESINDHILMSIAAFASCYSFIFQCNPKVYDINTALQELDKITYSVNKNYVRKMLPYMNVYIWESGADGGIIAKAITTSDAGTYNDPNGDQYYKSSPPESLTENRVWIQFTNIPEIKISRDVIKRHPVLKDLTILKFAQGTTFPVSEDQANAIEEILAGKYIEPDPSAVSDESPDSSYAGTEMRSTHYWLYSPGDSASIWDECYENGIMAIGWDNIGDLQQYDSKEQMKQAMKDRINPEYSWKNAAHATWQFCNEIQPGDVIFAKKGRNTIIGKGVVTSGYTFDPSREHYLNVRNVDWTDQGEWPHPGKAALKSLTDITAYTDYVEKLNALFESETEETEENIEVDYPPYTAEDFLKTVYMDSSSYETLVSLVRTKKNVILQGAPGVGKTYAAKRLAYSMMGVKDQDRVSMIQFHQSYSYEDFIQGFRPTESGYELKNGVFYNFCKRAEIDSDNEYFFIIDEINRGNLSKIFGELFMLIENDKRGIELQLLYSDELFSIPKNVYIIGMMNTADRSLAMLDYALRRRFAFFEMKPGFNTEGFQAYRKALNNPSFDKLIDCIDRLNAAIASDDSLGEGFCVGHSYFCNFKEIDDQALSSIVEYEIIPLLKEYWFDDPVKVKNWSNDLRSSIK